MKRIKAFFYVYINSLFNVKYYRDLINVKLDFSFKYFMILGTLAAVITTAGVTFQITPQVKKAVNDAVEFLRQAYPEELVITAKDGEWQINQPEPYAIPVPQFFSPEMFEEEYSDQVEFDNDFPANLIVFDHNGTINDLEELDTFTILNDVNLISLNGNNGVEVHPIDTIPDGEFAVENYTSMIDTLESYTQYIPAAILFLVFLGVFFYYLIFRAVYLVFVALALLAVGNILGIRHDFKTYYKLGLHTLTLPLTIETLFAVLAITAAIPFWFFGINIIFGITVVYFLSNMDLPVSSEILASGEKSIRDETVEDKTDPSTKPKN